MRLVVKVIETITEVISGYLMAWLTLALMILIMVNVFTRYVMVNPLSIGEEYGGFMLVGITCIGLAYAWKARSHVRVEFIINKLPVKMKRRLRLGTLVCAMLFTVFFAYASYALVCESFMFGARTMSWLRTPVAWPQMMILIGAVLMCLQLVAEIIKHIQKFSKPEEEGE